MQAELAAAQPAAAPVPGPRAAIGWRLVLPGTITATLAVELALAERRFAIFGGGFGQSQALDHPAEILAFLAALVGCHVLLFALAYRLLRRLHGGAARPVFLLNFVFFAGAGWLAALFARYEALGYFSDALSFQIVRNLGGGSLADALLYSLSEAGLVLAAAAGALLAYAAALVLLRRRAGLRLADAGCPGRGALLALAAAAPLLLLGAGRIDDSRAALGRFHAVFVLSAPLHALTDFDRDGWSLFSYPIDAHPFDSARHPYALDVPGNGIDEDGLAGDLSVRTEPDAATAPVIAGDKRHILLVVLESTRGDVIGKRIDGRPVAPTLEALARRGSFAREAHSHVGFTAQSLQTLFTGRLSGASPDRSLIRDFHANGYRVGVFSGQSEAFGGIAEATGMRAADIFVDAETLKDERGFGFAAPGSLYVDGRLLLREFDRHLGRPEHWQRPNFLYFNFQSAHFPYSAPGMDRILEPDPVPRSAIRAENRERVERTYWNAVAYSDRLLAELLDRLSRLGVLHNTLIAVTADHGESLFDDGFLGHGHMLNDQQTQIPFVLSDPGVPLPRAVGLKDMRAILLASAGAEVSAKGSETVFQYLGTLDRPGSIAIVDEAGERTIFDLHRQSVWFSRSGRSVRYADLRAGSAARREADAVVAEWGRQRWLHRTAR